MLAALAVAAATVFAVDVESDAWSAAQALKSAKKSIEAAGSFESFAELFPDSRRKVEARVEAGVCWFMAGRDAQVHRRSTPATRDTFAKSQAILRSVLADSPKDPQAGRAQYMLGSVALFDGALEDAEAAYDAVVVAHPTDKVYYPKALERRAFVRRQLLETQAMLEDLRRFEKEFGLKTPEGQLVARALESAKPLGQPAVPFQVESWVSGEPTPIELLGGQVVALYFYASWCTQCAEELPLVLDLHQRFASRGVAFVGISNHGQGQTAEQVKQHAAKNAIPFAIVMEPGATTTAYGATSIPYVVLVDREGRIRWRDTPANLADRTLEILLAEGLEPAK